MGIGVSFLILGILLIAFTFVNVPKIISEPYSVPKSTELIAENFVFASSSTVTHTIYLNAYDNLTIQLEVTSSGNDDINFEVENGSTTYVSYTGVSDVDTEWIVPMSSNYTFVYDNSFSSISKNVTVIVTNYYTDIAYRDVTVKSELLPFEFVYLGLALTVVGIDILIFGGVKKK